MRVLHVGHGFRPFHHGGLIAYAEDLMDAQVERGHDVSYFFSGRHYPLVKPRVRRWTRRGTTMYELLCSPVTIGEGDRGTRHPERDLHEATVERLFRSVLDHARPELVHVQELAGLPSSLLELPDVPVVMTLHDYLTLCPVVKLFDVNGEVCRRTDPAPVCVQCCRDAPAGNEDAIRLTLRHHKRQLPLLDRLPGPGTVKQWLGRGHGEPQPEHAPALPPVEPFRARRAANVERLNRVDLLLAVSPRVEALYTELGVERITTLPIALTHLRSLKPRRIVTAPKPIRFVTLNGCASAAKGAHVVAGALELLHAQGITEQDLTVDVAGHIDLAVKDRLVASPLARLTGDYTPQDLDRLLGGAHAGIVPSLWEETFGFVALEMLAKGLPVIGNERGGVAEHVNDGRTGWLNRSSDAEGLAQIIAAIAADPNQIVDLNARIAADWDSLIPSMSDHATRLDELYRAQISSTARPDG